MRLQGSAADFKKLSIAPETLDLVISNVAGATKDLNSIVCNDLTHGGGEEFDAIGGKTVTRVVKIDLLRHIVGVGAASHVLRVALANVLLDLSKGSEGLTKGNAVLGILVHDLKAAASDTTAHCTECDALNLEVAHHAKDSAALFSDEVGSRDTNLIKNKFGSGTSAHTTLVLDTLAETESRHTLLYKEERDGAGSSSCVDKEDISEGVIVDASVCDPHF
mmetsp:Transcript_11547/g.22712  ORF Transcript_11547/g.22712 Transcript_11547/m.22712 type:complete len:220 (-) Transcript_11547:669-1328(-)